MMVTDDSREAFRRHYETDESHWGGHSGGGSLPYWNIEYRGFLERFIHLNNIRSIVDIGCGDWQFSRFLNLDEVSYQGYDVVDSVVQRNTERYGRDNIRFSVMPQDFGDVASADLLIMKDVLQHLPTEVVIAHQVLFDRYPRSLISNSYRKMGATVNNDIGYGDFRCLDLVAAPFHFPGNYVLEFSSPLHEEIRTLLYVPRAG